MQNPILQMLNGNKTNQNNSMLQNIGAVKDFILKNDSSKIFNFLMNSNSKFRDFVKTAENKTIEDIAMEYDLDLDMVKRLLN